MTDLVNQLQYVVQQSQHNLPLILQLLALLWVVQLCNALVQYRLNVLGIVPRTVHGLFGIVFAPFLHGGFSHLILNTVPLFLLMSMMLQQGVELFLWVSAVIIVLSGVFVWLFGRRAIHVGASSVIMGYWGYLLMGVYHHPTAIGVVLLAIVGYYFGGFVVAILPQGGNVSWEGHLGGLVAGLIAKPTLMLLLRVLVA